jgi:glycosyltransferase involved in cell wall biosynthesis/GT2 family glycosyltransferase
MRVSVVVCTYNRADALRHTLDALRYQTFTDFEVVVVNGPSTDHTADVLAEWDGRIEVATNPEPNLSISRNLGIAASAGDLVAFIDDDAIPEFDWLADIVEAFEADATGEVAGVGGLVFDHTGMDFQFRFAASSRLGEPKLSDTTPFDDLCLPGAFWFPYLQGTNAVFRRAALVEVGGFDETFDYYLDETDLCARLVDSGYLLRQLDDAHVHHKFLPSHLRNEERIVTRWYPVIKNLTYFGLRHAAGETGEDAVLAKARVELAYRVDESRRHETEGRVPPGTADAVRDEGAVAIEEGRRSAASPRPLGRLTGAPTFARFPVVGPPRDRCTVVVSKAYAETIDGGIARYLTDVVPALARLGREVRVVTRTTDRARVDLEDGIWVHRIEDDHVRHELAGTAPHIDGFATAALDEVRRIAAFRDVEVVYGPAWDLEVLPIARRTDLPVVALLATPVAVTNHLDPSLPYRPAPYAQLLLSLEREVFERATLLHADSEAVVRTIAERYGLGLGADRIAVAHLGAPELPEPPRRSSGEAPTLLYVGRVEPRKGVDTLLEAFVQVAAAVPEVRLRIVGPVNTGESDQVGPWLRRHAGAPWTDRVELAGRLDDDEVAAAYAEADVVVLPSRFESFGLTIVEAMRRGRPVVSTTAGAIPEVVVDGVTGLLVTPGEPGALAAAVLELLRDPARADTMGRAGMARFRDRFTIDAAAARLDRVLERAVAARRSVAAA